MAKSRETLERLLNSPNLPRIVPRLAPEVLHGLIHARGLQDSAELVALATPEQLARVLDSDVWRARTPGRDEEFDADRFGLWLTVLMECGAPVAAEKIVGLDIELVTAGLSQHVAAFDYAAAASYTTLDGEEVPGRRTHDGLVCELGGYLIEAGRTSAWDAIVDLLAFLESERPEYFHALMRGCVRLSSGAREEDGFHDLLDARAQDMFDVASDREARMEERGYVARAQAAAFLLAARDLRLDAGGPPDSAIAHAYFRAIEPAFAARPDAPPESDVVVASTPDTASQDEAEAAAALMDVLDNDGLISSQPRALLGAGDEEHSDLSFVHAHATSHANSEQELAYLANTMLAACSIQERPFTVREASACALSICNLGLENWPPRWSGRDLITAFQVGWTILHRDVCMYAAQRLIDVLGGIRCRDRDIQLRLDGLRRRLAQQVRTREPWRVRDDLDVILMLDAPAWAALCGLLDDCPVMHGALGASGRARRSIAPADFAFISHNRQIAAVHEFLARLPSLLTG